MLQTRSRYSVLCRSTPSRRSDIRQAATHDHDRIRWQTWRVVRRGAEVFRSGANWLGPLSQRIQAVSQRLDTERSAVRRLFFWAFLLRFGLGLAGWILTHMAGIAFFQDASYYEELGHLISQDWLAGRSSPWLSWAIDDGRAPWLLPSVIA